MNIKLNKEDNKKHILYLCSRNFFAPNTGHEIKMFNYLKGLKKTFNCDIDLFIFDKPSKDEINIKKYVSNITYGKSNNHLITFCNLFFKTLFNNWPIQNSLYYNKDNFNEIKKIAQNTHYDMLIVDMIRLDAYSNAIEYPCLKILDMDDLLSKRYQRQLSKLNKKSSIAGAYEEKLNPFIRFFIKNKIIKKIILKMEIKRLKIAEEKAYQKYDHLLFVSQKEANEININYHNHKAIGIGLGVDYSYFSKQLSRYHTHV